MARRIDWNYDPAKNRRTKPVRRTETIADMIRRNNGGFLASEVSAGRAPGGQAAVVLGPYADTRTEVRRRMTIPSVQGAAARDVWSRRNVTVSRGPDGRPVSGPVKRVAGQSSIGGFGTPGETQGRRADGSPIPGALPAYMPYDKRFPDAEGRRDWLQERWGRQAAEDLGRAVAASGSDVTFTGGGATGVRTSTDRTGGAVAPGSPAGTSGVDWNVVRAGIHNQAVKQAMTGQSGPVDMADPASVAKFEGDFAKRVGAAKSDLAGRFVDNIHKSIVANTPKSPSSPSPEKTAMTHAGYNLNDAAGSGDADLVIDSSKAFVDASKADSRKFQEAHKKSVADTKATGEWIKNFAKRHGLKDPTQSAAKGGRSGTPAAKHRRSDTLGTLIEDLDRYGEYEPMYGETELTEKELVDYDAARARARDANLPVDDPRYRRDEPSGKVYRKWSRFDLSDGERALLRREGADAEVEALRAMFDYAKAGGEGARDVRDIRNLAWNLRRNREAGR